jgi:hypothetical protein
MLILKIFPITRSFLACVFFLGSLGAHNLGVAPPPPPHTQRYIEEMFPFLAYAKIYLFYLIIRRKSMFLK